jgi:hypothetical protein
MESITDNERAEARAIEREPADRPTRQEVAEKRMVPDVAGRDLCWEPAPGDPF